VITGRSRGWVVAKVRRGLVWCNAVRVQQSAGAGDDWRRCFLSDIEASSRSAFGGAGAGSLISHDRHPNTTTTTLDSPRPTPTSLALSPCPCSYSSYSFYPSCPSSCPRTAQQRPALAPLSFPARHPHVPRSSPTGCPRCIDLHCLHLRAEPESRPRANRQPSCL
jgi:hypothetical protein